MQRVEPCPTVDDRDNGIFAQLKVLAQGWECRADIGNIPRDLLKMSSALIVFEIYNVLNRQCLLNLHECLS